MFGKQSLYLVLGGHLREIGGAEFTDLSELHLVGIFPSFEEAEREWRARSQASVDDAAMCYRVVALHNIISPGDTVAEFLATHQVSDGLRVDADVSITEVCRQMVQGRISAAFITEEGRPIGIFTERDLVRLVIEAPHGWREEPIRNYMTTAVQSVQEGDLLIEALQTMQKGHFRHLPVTDAKGRLKQVISIRDFAFKDRT